MSKVEAVKEALVGVSRTIDEAPAFAVSEVLDSLGNTAVKDTLAELRGYLSTLSERARDAATKGAQVHTALDEARWSLLAILEGAESEAARTVRNEAHVLAATSQKLIGHTQRIHTALEDAMDLLWKVESEVGAAADGQRIAAELAQKVEIGQIHVSQEVNALSDSL